jgi:hypothetical protein
MSISGKREGVGRKSHWRSPTKMMRLPVHYEQQILDYAHHLESEAESEPTSDESESESESITLAELQVQIRSLLLSIPPKQRVLAARWLKRLLKQLDGAD